MNNGNKSKKSKKPNWLNGQRRRIGIRMRTPSVDGDLPRTREVQFRNDNFEDASNSKRKHRSSSRYQRTNQSGARKNRRIDEGENRSNIRGYQHRKLQITLGQLRESLDDETLQELLNDNFDPNKLVDILILKKVSQFAEDCIIKAPKQRRRKGKTKLPPKLPSIKFGQSYEQYRNDGIANENAVLGCYFTHYLRLFGEEDPEWVGISCVRALSIIKSMATLLCNGDYKPIIDYIEMLLPLWAERLERKEEFPSSRPSVDMLFVRRKIWAQRFNLYNRWN